MPPELSLPRPFERMGAVPQTWRKPLLQLALAWAMMLTFTAGDWADMAHQWWDSSTYNHVLFVPAILAWLIKLRLPELAKLKPEAWWPGLILLTGALFLWLLGELSNLNLASQLGAVLALQAALVALMGVRIAAALLFPLGYMLFLVPFGDELIPALQLITARLAIALTHWSGVPAQIEGVFIDTPAGLFEVAEACSGVKFLIAMVALGTLVAHLCYRSPWRRSGFMVAAVVLPILANGVRAWGTIYIAQSQGVQFAAGFDHIVYGWIFFALVMAALLGGAWRTFDRAPDDPPLDADRIAASPALAAWSRFRMPCAAALAGIAAIALAFLLWTAAARAVQAPLPERITLPPVTGWQPTEYRPQVLWEPRATGADRRLLRRYRDAKGNEVDVFVALYAGRLHGREAGAYGEGALVPDSAWRWLEPAGPIAGGDAAWLQADGRVRRLAVTWYGVGGAVTGSASRLKLATMTNRLLMRSQPTVMLIVSAENRPGHPARASIAAFLSHADGPDAWMDRIAQVP
jgi:exosortase A